MTSLLLYFLNQNPVMMALLGLSVLCLAAILDRILFWISSALRYRPLPAVLRAENVDGLDLYKKELDSRKNRHYSQEILLISLQQPTNRSLIMQTASEQVELMTLRLGILDVIAKMSPLVGILGTVIGMAVSFGGISEIVTASPAAISQGISLALQTTAWGLVISIVATTASAVFRKFTRTASLKMGRLICEYGKLSS